METDSRSIEFLDLSDVSEQERNFIVSSLYSTSPYLNLPWDDHHSLTNKTTVKSLNSCGIQENIIQSNATVNHINNEANTLPVYQQPFTKPFPLQNHVNNHCMNTPATVTAVDNVALHLRSTTIQDNVASTNTNGHVYINVGANQHNFQVENVEVEQNNGMDETEQNLEETGKTPTSANKSWASLFNKGGKDESSNKSLEMITPFVDNVEIAKGAQGNKFDAANEPFKSCFDDPVLYKFGEYLSKYTINNHVNSLQPRGLINRSNYCYINSILQAILACPPLYNLLNDLSSLATITNQNKKIIPVIESMTKFIQQFRTLPNNFHVAKRSSKKQQKENTAVIDCDAPFEPFWIYKMLSGMQHSFVVEGRQEDAEEFLGCLLNALNDEMLELTKPLSGPELELKEASAVQGDDIKEWQVIGPKNKGSIIRNVKFSRTPISDIFGGRLRSRIHRAGDQPTDNIQPFYTLQLNIEKAHSVREALEVLVSKNQLEGVTSSRTNEEVEAWQQVTLDELPTVLVLHLKCFDYKLDGCSKLMKTLEYSVDLKIDSKLLSFKTNYTPKEKQYKLFAVVYHDGKEATKGHYVTDAYHIGYTGWLRYDDASVKAVPEEHVLKPHGSRVPYLLFYRRSDSIRSK